MARPVVEQVSSLDGVTTEGFLDATSNFGACAGIWDAGFGEAENGIGTRRTRLVIAKETTERWDCVVCKKFRRSVGGLSFDQPFHVRG